MSRLLPRAAAGAGWCLFTRLAVNRFVGGLLNANQAVLRAQLRELMPEEHRSQAFASLGQAWGVGFMLGPLIGGSLARPAAVLPSLAGSPLDVYPYLLPSLAAAALCLLGTPAARALPLVKAFSMKSPIA